MRNLRQNSIDNKISNDSEAAGISRMKKADWLIPAAAVVTAAIWYGLLIFKPASATTANAGDYGDKVVVTVSGKGYAVYSLNSETDVIIPGARGLNNHLVIHDGEANVVEADCPDKLCVHQKAISKDGDLIVCLPNEVVVEIVHGEEGDYDAVAN